MSKSNDKNQIPILEPLVFKKELIDRTWNARVGNLKINEFFIHSFKEEFVPLKLPLPLHKKTVNDFVLVTKGEMTKTIGLASFSLKTNHFLLTPKNSITTSKNVSKDLEGFYCHFSDDFLVNHPHLKRWHSHSPSQNLLQLTDGQMQIVLPLLRRISQLYRQMPEEPANYQLIHYYLSTFLAEISSFANKDLSQTPVHPLVIEFQKEVNNRFKESKNVKFYADLLHISPNHLNKIIKSETGQTASYMINQICILEAKVLLIQTNQDVGAIAFELGYDDTSYFSRFFKKQTGVSPTDFRKMIDLS